MKTEQWGFDLTDISIENWKQLMKQFNLTDAGLQTSKALFEGDQGTKFWSWENPAIQIRTGNNPLTGEYAGPLPREPETGYASYIGIEGEPDLVKQAAAFIRQHGQIKGADLSIGESPNECGFI